MKIKAIALAIVAIMVIAGGIAAVQAGNENNGNGAPSGQHYTLNILGKNWDRKESIPQNNGHRIFVGLGNKDTMCKTKIMLQEGDTFDVIDCDGTDGQATFQLPKPYAEDDVDFEYPAYQVWIRVQSPKGKADMYTTLYDGTTWFVSEEVIVLEGKPGNKKFEDVTKELTTIYADITDDDIYNPVRIGLFDDDYEGWLWAWDYDNYGLKHVQMRFYPVEYA